MNGNDIDGPAFRPAARDLWTAFGLLTRLPLPFPDFDATDPRPAAHAAWAYPLVGLVVALIMGLTGSLAMAIGLPAEPAALLMLLAGVLTTGALHEDGLADCADGFWGGWNVERRLEIMKDSQIGAYGVIVLILALGMKIVALAGLLAAGTVLMPLLASAMLSRASMVGVMHLLPNARGTGLSKRTGHPPRAAALTAGALALVAALLLGWVGVLALLLAAAAAATVALVARRKIKGQTGDVLGATQQVVEITVLLTCLATLP